MPPMRSQNQCGILFPIENEVSAKEEYLIKPFDKLKFQAYTNLRGRHP